MSVTTVALKVILCLPVLSIAGRGAHLCSAQSLQGMKVAEPSATLGRLGVPSESDSYKGMAVRQWNLPNGNSLSVTTGPNGIVFIESDWNGKNDDPGVIFPDFDLDRQHWLNFGRDLGVMASATRREDIQLKHLTES